MIPGLALQGFAESLQHVEEVLNFQLELIKHILRALAL